MWPATAILGLMRQFAGGLLACPNCKESLNEPVSAGYAWSIALMISLPLFIVSVWAVAIFLLSKSAEEPLVDRGS